MLLLGAILHKGTTLGQQQLKHGQQILHHAKLSIQLDPKVSPDENCLFLLQMCNSHDHCFKYHQVANSTIKYNYSLSSLKLLGVL